MLVEQAGHFSGQADVLGLRLKAKAFKKINDRHGYAQVFKFPDRRLRVFSSIVRFLPGALAANATEKDRHIVPTAHSHKGRVLQPRSMRRSEEQVCRERVE